MPHMRLHTLLGLVIGLIASSAHAQTTTNAVPNIVNVLVLAPGTDPATASPVAQFATNISATSGSCNVAALPPAGGTPLVNPTHLYFVDPFNAGKFCSAVIPVLLPTALQYQAVLTFSAPTCLVNGLAQSPCTGPRSVVAVPPFDIQPIQGPPVAPTGPAVRP